MTQYLATINIPGYLPMDDDPPVFDKAHEAWAYLAEIRERDEDGTAEDGDESYSDTREQLAVLGTPAHWRSSDRDDPGADVREWLTEHGLADDGTGTVHGATPGYDGDHDLGLSYTVQIAEDV